METKYTILEKQNFASQRTPLHTGMFSSLTAAKRYASCAQVFHGTVLVIVDEDTGLQVASKEPGGRWHTEEWA